MENEKIEIRTQNILENRSAEHNWKFYASADHLVSTLTQQQMTHIQLVNKRS